MHGQILYVNNYNTVSWAFGNILGKIFYFFWQAVCLNLLLFSLKIGHLSWVRRTSFPTWISSIMWNISHSIFYMGDIWFWICWSWRFEVLGWQVLLEEWFLLFWRTVLSLSSKFKWPMTLAVLGPLDLWR